MRDVASLERDNELRQHRDDDPECEHVERDSDEDERERRAGGWPQSADLLTSAWS
jgi:hypothetical protein